MKKADVCREYRNKYPNMPTLKLARIVYEENKMMFKNVEDARHKLRYIEGKTGKQNIFGPIKDSKYFMQDSRPYNPYKLPDSDETKFEPFILEAKKVGVICDVHAPYHNIVALTTAIDFFKKEKVDAVLILGDLIDFYSLSRYAKDPRKRHFAQEIAIATQIIMTLESTLKAPVYFKYGNHEERYDAYLFMKAKEIVGLEDVELRNIIKKRVPNVTIIEDKRIVKLGDLNAVHGHEFGMGGIFSPVNIARGLFLKSKSSAICGHHHRTSEHTEQTLDGKILTTWSIGCTSEIFPNYMPINSWNHGACIVEISGKDFHVRNYRIYKGKIL